jgi:hypothetical protein
MEKVFNFEKAVQELLSGKKLTGKDGILTPLIKEGSVHNSVSP